MKIFRHRFWTRLNTGTALLLAAVIVLMLNYLSARHYYRADWSAKQFYNLSPKTTALLDSLETQVNVTVFFEPSNVLYEDVQNLMRQYQYNSKKLNILWVDPNRDLSMVDQMKSKYEITEPNVVVFECGTRSKYVRANEIAQVDASSGIKRIITFRGEQSFSSAILGVVQQTAPVVYFLTDH